MYYDRRMTLNSGDCNLLQKGIIDRTAQPLHDNVKVE
jgi:hypothetical protein